MESSFFYGHWKIVAFIALWFLFSTAVALVLSPFYPEAWIDQWIMSLFLCGTLCMMMFMLKMIVKKGKLLALSFPWNITVFVALGLLTMIVWLGADSLLLYLFAAKQWIHFYPTLPFFAMLGVFVYVIEIQRFMMLHKSITPCVDDVEEQFHHKLASSQHQEDASVVDRISVKINSNIHVIPVETIFYLKSEGDYVLIFSEQGKFIKEQTMKYFEQHLPAHLFVRIHRSFIVNVKAISRIESYGKNKQMLILRTGVQLNMSVVGYRALKMLLHL